jgi:hypothetical protein
MKDENELKTVPGQLFGRTPAGPSDITISFREET